MEIPVGRPMRAASSAPMKEKRIRYGAGTTAPQARPLEAAPLEKMLLVSLHKLGDLIFVSALVPPLREHFPQARIAVWCKAYTADAAALIPGIDEVFAADPFWLRSPGRGKGSLRAFLLSALAVRRQRFDAALLTPAISSRITLATALAGIPLRIGMRGIHSAHWLTHALAPEDASQPVLAEMSRLLEPLGIARRPLRYKLDPTPLAARRRELLAHLGEAPIGALHPFSAKPATRCVVLGEWLRIAEGLSRRGLSPLWVGSPAELQGLRSAGLQNPWPSLDQLGDGSLAHLAAALSMASLFIGHDSGPLHMASAFGVPSVGVFPARNANRTFPQGTGPWRILERPSSPVNITAETVLAQVDEMGSMRQGGAAT
jgi:ADP-heptose:LPS heptosyltransferase